MDTRDYIFALSVLVNVLSIFALIRVSSIVKAYKEFYDENCLRLMKAYELITVIDADLAKMRDALKDLEGSL